MDEKTGAYAGAPIFYMEYILIVGRAVLGVNPKGWEKIGRVQY